MSEQIGLDGCKAGWCLVAWNGERWRVELLPHIEALNLATDSLALIDIPIGLPEQQSRQCDARARQLLKPFRHHSVFNAPCRAAVYCDDYRTANQLNRQQLGKGLSQQSFNLSAKIRQVDIWQCREYHAQLREAHPELCFARLNHGEPMRHNKKTAAGQAERLALLARYAAWANDCWQYGRTQYRRAQVADDDILDALVLCLSAAYPLQRLPEQEIKDARGLPMEIVAPRIEATPCRVKT